MPRRERTATVGIMNIGKGYRILAALGNSNETEKLQSKLLECLRAYLECVLPSEPMTLEMWLDFFYHEETGTERLRDYR